ncbi:MAG: protein kinase [Gemmatimonadales bacterium]
MAATIPCKSCGKPVPVGDRFCSGCGTLVVNDSAATVMLPQTQGTGSQTQCVKCGASMGRDDRFCPKCGASRPEEATVVSHLSLRNAQAAHLIEATKGEFEILQQLGTGAMGAVYLAKDISLGRKVAIKVIASNLLSDATMISRFRFEAQTVASLRHPNIVNVHAVRQSADLHYFVMEFIDGPPLRNIVKTHAPLEVDVVQAIIFQVGSALAYAHRSAGGVIHRDVKPANIMVDKEGDAFVTDFGISKMSEAQSGLTQTGATIGTPEYMSPEQCRGDALTGASDQYALGIVAYEMLVGHVPFTGSQYNIMVSHTSERPKPILAARSDCPTEVAEAIERMLAKTPQERWPDLDTAVAAMGGAPLGYQSPVRQKIKALTGATLASIPAVRTGQPGAVSGGARTLDTATSVSVIGLPSLLETGERVQLKADVKGAGNTSLGGQGVIWASTDPAIAKVEGGWVEALAPGSVSIMASAGNVASSVLLTIEEPKAAKVLVRPASVTMQKGGKMILSALVQDKRGKDLPRPVRWKSADPAIATVSPKGEVVAKGAGPVTITAEAEGASGTSAIVVEAPVVVAAPPPPAPVPPEVKASAEPLAAAPKAEPPKAEPPKADVPAPKAPAAAAPKSPAKPKPAPPPVAPAAKPKSTPTPVEAAPPRAKPAPPAPRPAATDRPIYRHPGAIAASVVLLGALVFGVVSMGGGEAEPASDPATSQGGAAPLATTPAGGAAIGGAPAPGPATVEPPPPASAGGQPAGSTPPPTQTAATDPPAAAAPPSTSPSGGAATPPARGGGAAPPTPARVDIGQLAGTMQPGGTATATAQVYASSGGAMSSGFTLAWRSSNPAAVSVDPRTGALRAAGPGTAWIVAAAGDARDSVRLTVSAPPTTASTPPAQPPQQAAPTVARVEIAGSDLELEVGSSAPPLAASALDANGRPVSRPVSWSSSNTQVATVDAAGRVTAVGAGRAQITASVAGRSDQVGVTVAAAEPPAAPAPAPVAAAPALPSAADARAAVEGYLAALGRNDRDLVTRLWGAAPAGNRGDLLDAMNQRDFRVTLGTVSAPVADGAGATVTFPVAAAWRSSFGQNRDGSFNFRARLERAGTEWSLASVVLQ